jgi:SulP family sulfate permease
MFASLKPAIIFFLRPIELFRGYAIENLRFDLIAGLTVAVILLPQAIAFALIVEAPPSMGLYTAIVGAIIGGLWGSSPQMHTGPTNALSLLILSVLLSVGIYPESPDFLVALGVMAVMVGVFQVAMGLARLGLLVNFVSDSVIVGFTAGAGVLIMFNQVRHLFGLSIESSPELLRTLKLVTANLADVHILSLLIGGTTIILLVIFKRFAPKWPGLLITMITVSAIGAAFGMDQYGLKVIGELPRNLPPLARLPLFDLDLLGRLSTGALSVAAIGLVAAMSIARSAASQTGQPLDSNQEFVGQGLANIASGVFSGFAVSGSFALSAVKIHAGARTAVTSLASGIFVFLAMLILAPLAQYIPRATLAGALMVIGFGMIDWQEMARIWRGTRGDTMIMMATLLGTLLLDLEFAVIIGILISLVRYVIKTSVPKVFAILPDDDYNHLIPRTDRPCCPQMGIMDILGDLYFGAVSHVEHAIRQNMDDHPEQTYLLLRMRSVQHCDISGIHMLENIMRSYRDKGGDLYLMRVQQTVKGFMVSTGFDRKLGKDHFLPDDGAVSHMFYHILDPAICIYECDVRAFSECQNLPKQTFDHVIPLHPIHTVDHLPTISPQDLWQQLHKGLPHPVIIDVREPREFGQGHIPDAQLRPLSRLMTEPVDFPADRSIVLVCRSGRRSMRAAQILKGKGFNNTLILAGGMMAWERSSLLEAVDEITADAIR